MPMTGYAKKSNKLPMLSKNWQAASTLPVCTLVKHQHGMNRAFHAYHDCKYANQHLNSLFLHSWHFKGCFLLLHC